MVREPCPQQPVPPSSPPTELGACLVVTRGQGLRGRGQCQHQDIRAAEVTSFSWPVTVRHRLVTFGQYQMNKSLLGASRNSPSLIKRKKKSAQEERVPGQCYKNVTSVSIITLSQEGQVEGMNKRITDTIYSASLECQALGGEPHGPRLIPSSSRPSAGRCQALCQVWALHTEPCSLRSPPGAPALCLPLHLCRTAVYF